MGTWGTMGTGDAHEGRAGTGDPLTQEVIRCVLQVYHTLGPGFLESVYRRALLVEMRRSRLTVAAERRVFIYYAGEEVGMHRLDLIVEERLVLELKAVESLHRAHYAQIRSYLRASGIPLGLLVNFSGPRADFRRVESP
jgi:GxxExxY protein